MLTSIFVKGQDYKVNGLNFFVKDGKNKYELLDKYVYHIPIEFSDLYKHVKPFAPICLSNKGQDFIILHANGTIELNKQYACDGCSGPTFDDTFNIRGGFLHDSLYQLIEKCLIPNTYANRKLVDQLFRVVLLKDGCHHFRAGYYYRGVRLFGWLFV